MLSRTLGSSRRFNAIPAVNHDLAEFAQLLFALLVPHVDDFGRMSLDSESLKFQVFPGSSRSFPEFWTALEMLHIVRLVDVYRAKDCDNEDAIFLQVNKFDDHQTGLHKRTKSRYPNPPTLDSRKFPEIPGQRNVTELNVTERKIGAVVVAGGVQGGNGNHHHNGTTARSNHPIFTGNRFTVFEWMRDDIMKMLGAHCEAFDVMTWLDHIDQEALRDGHVIARKEQWPYIQAALLEEAKRRGLPIISVPDPTRKPTQSEKIAATLAAIDAKAEPIRKTLP